MIDKNRELALSFVDTHALTILFNCMSSQIEMHNMFIKRQNKNKHGSFVYTCSKLEENQIFINNALNKPIVMYFYNMKL